MKKTTMGMITAVFLFTVAATALAQEKYPIKGQHKGGDITPAQAYEMLQKDPEHTFLVDVRTRYEYQDIGHPVGAYNIPWKFYTTKVDAKGYAKTTNPNFSKDLLARFNPETDTLLLMCRSAHRTIPATTAAVDAGFKADKVYNVLAGFEGDKIKDKDSPWYGKRRVAGWRLENLPWTYHMDHNLMYQSDLAQ